MVIPSMPCRFSTHDPETGFPSKKRVQTPDARVYLDDTFVACVSYFTFLFIFPQQTCACPKSFLQETPNARKRHTMHPHHRPYYTSPQYNTTIILPPKPIQSILTSKPPSRDSSVSRPTARRRYYSAGRRTARTSSGPHSRSVVAAPAGLLSSRPSAGSSRGGPGT